MAQIYKKHIPRRSAPWSSLTLKESLTGMCTSSEEGGPGGYGTAGLDHTPPEGEKNPSPQQTSPRATPSEDSTGPLVGPSRTRFHWATRSTMTWRHAGWGRGILRRSGRLFSTSVPGPAYAAQVGAPFVAPIADIAGGFALLQLSFFPLPSCSFSVSFSTPDHETFGPLLAPAQTCSPLFVTSGGQGEPGGVDGAVCVWRSERSGALGWLEASGLFRDRAFGQWEGFAGEPGGVHQCPRLLHAFYTTLCTVKVLA